MWLSNALCNGVTGNTIFQRVLHSDEDIGVYYFQRVIALTTIAIRHDVADDLTDRIPLVEPEVIEVRRTEVDITAARAAALPAGLGAALDLVAGVLRELPGTAVDNAPRIADFPKVLAALDAATGWDTLGSYRAKGRQPGAVADRGQHLRLRDLPARHCPSPGGLYPGPVGRHRRRAARHPPPHLRRRLHARLRSARGSTRGRPPGPRDRPIAAQGRHRHQDQRHRQAPGPAHPQNHRPRPGDHTLRLSSRRARKHTSLTSLDRIIAGQQGVRGEVGDATSCHSYQLGRAVDVTFAA